MSKSRDPLALSAHWHVDCTLNNELPDDRVVSSRFLVNLPFGAITLVLMVVFGLKLSNDLTLRGFINDWDRRIAESRVEIASIKQMQRDYSTASTKIEEAHQLVKNRLFVYDFVNELGRTRPEQMVINTIESTGYGVLMRGTLGESSERATLMIGQYVAQLAN
ncbi:MAG: hypothetical protein ABI222_01570, partial [Opitutaceae bacterium]